MLYYIRLSLITLLGAIAILGYVPAPTFAQMTAPTPPATVQPSTQSTAITKLRAGLKDTAGRASISTATDGLGLPGLIGRLIGGVLSFLAAAFFGIALFAGFRWMFARDDEAKAKKSVAMITSAIIGLIIILGAYAITNFVLDSVGVRQGQISAPGAGAGPGPAPAANFVPVGGACISTDECVAGAECDITYGTCRNKCDGLLADDSGGRYSCQAQSDCNPTTIQPNMCSGNTVCCLPNFVQPCTRDADCPSGLTCNLSIQQCSSI